ncbi:MAG: DUF2752 domain-containing protein [Actinomycetota bacterium]
MARSALAAIPRPTPGLAAFTAFGLGAVLGIGLAATADDGPVVCPVRRCTGGYCPGCGLTRAAGSLARGDVAGSWQYHPLLVVVLAQVLVVAPLVAVGPSLGARLGGARALLAALVANGALAVVIWAVRIATGAIPGPFGLGPL